MQTVYSGIKQSTSFEWLDNLKTKDDDSKCKRNVIITNYFDTNVTSFNRTLINGTVILGVYSRNTISLTSKSFGLSFRAKILLDFASCSSKVS